MEPSTARTLTEMVMVLTRRDLEVVRENKFSARGNWLRAQLEGLPMGLWKGTSDENGGGIGRTVYGNGDRFFIKSHDCSKKWAVVVNRNVVSSIKTRQNHKVSSKLSTNGQRLTTVQSKEKQHQREQVNLPAEEDGEIER